MPRAPDLRVLVTSRARRCPSPTGSSARWPRCATGEPDDPGPAALLAADFSSIPRRDIVARWATIEGSAGSSGGVPLALRLLADAAATGELPAADGPGVDLVGDAARAALGRLAPRAVDLVTTLAELPVPVTVPLVARILTARRPELAGQPGCRAAGRPGDASLPPVTCSRVRVLDPVAAVLRPHGPDPAPRAGSRRGSREVTIDLLDAAQPSLVGRPDLAGFAAVDDDHDAVQLGPPPPAGPAPAAPREPPGRGVEHLRRNLEEQRMLADLEPLVDAAPPIERVRYWAMRAQISPALSAGAALAAAPRGRDRRSLTASGTTTWPCGA